MVRISKHKRELEAEKDAHCETRKEYIEALQVAQYLKVKVESLRNVIAGLTVGTELKIMLHGYGDDLEAMERIVLERAAHRVLEGEINDQNHEVTFPAPELPNRQKRRKLKHTSSDDAADLIRHFTSSDGITVDPANIFSSHAICPTDTIATSSDPPKPEPEAVDLEALELQFEQAREVMGELADMPVAQRILHKAPMLTREQLERMRFILHLDVEARTSIFAFADDLLGD